MDHWPHVSIVVLNWNTFALTRDCLASLRQVTYPNWNLILVDNGSTDGSGEALSNEFSEVIYIQNEENLGFSRGCNIGIRRALADGSDYVMLLNSDMVVEKGFLEPAVRIAESDPRIGLVSGKIYLKDRPRVLWYAGGSVGAWRGVSVRGWCQTDGGQFDEPCEVGFSTGALMLIKRTVLGQIGLLPEAYFFGQEEWDYSLAARQAGFKLYFAPGCVTYHKSDGSHRNTSPKFLYNGFRNRLIFHKKFLAPPIFWLWKQVWHFYQRFIAHWRLAHLDRETLSAIPYAFRAAVRDDKRAKGCIISEADLSAFQNEFQYSSSETHRRFVCLTNIPTPYRLHFFRALAHELAERGWSFEVFFMAETERGRNWRLAPREFGFPHRFLTGKSLWIADATLHINFKFLLEFLKRPPDILLTAGSWGLPTNILTTLTLTFARGSTVIFWSESHIRSMRRKGRLIELLRKRLMRKYHGFAVPGKLAIDYVNHYAPDKPVYKLPNTVSEALFRDEVSRFRHTRHELREAMQIANDKRVLLIPARLMPDKGIEEFLLALFTLPESIQQSAILLIAGDGLLRTSLQQQIAEVPSLDARLMGYLSEQEMVKLYAIVDGVALPSLHDPNPLSVIEALWAELPLLLSDRVGNLTEVLQPGMNGWLFDPESADDIRKAFVEWCAAPESKLRAYGSNSLQIATDQFETGAVVRAFIAELLEQVSESPSAINAVEAQT